MRNSFSGRAGAAAGAAGRFFGRHPLLRCVLVPFIRTLPAALALMAVLYGLLYDSAVEAALNLKHNSPLILWPMGFFVGASGTCAVAGWLFFRHRYKRPKSKSDSVFSRTFSVILEETSTSRRDKEA